MGLGKGRKVPQSVKTQRKIDAAVDEALKQQKQAYVRVKTRDDIEIEQLRIELEKASKQPTQIIPVTPDYADGIFGKTKHTGLIVQNWHTAWKWVSTWAFGLIAYVSVAGIPPEVLALVPEASQSKVTAALALLGFFGRFINQSRGK